MKLLEMKLENFQGIDNLELKFDGLSKSIHGDNATGKTTVANAQSWLLTGKSSDNEKNYTPKTEGSHNLNHSVECRYQLEDMSIVTLKKLLKEKYTKKRGSADSEFTGHVVEYYKDGVPMKENEFNSYIETIIGPQDVILMLSNVSYFSKEITWQNRRQLLLDMCGDYSDEDVISSNPEIIELNDILIKPGTVDQRYTVDEFIKMSKEKMKMLDKEVKSIPDRIDEAKKAIPSLDGLNRSKLEDNLELTNTRLSDMRTRLASLNSDNAQLINKQRAVEKAKNDMRDARIRHQNEYSDSVSEINHNIQEKQISLNNIQNSLSSKEYELNKTKNELETMTSKRNDLLKRYHDIKALEWDESKEICPTCGQSLPVEKIDDLKKKFNLEKSENLNEINTLGQSVSKESISSLEERISVISKDVASLGSEMIIIKNDISAMESNKPTLVPFEETREYQALSAAIYNAENIEITEDQNAAMRNELNDDISILENHVRELNSQIGQFVIEENQNKRIRDLADTKRKKSEEYEKLERKVHICDEFTKAKVRMITENINQKFTSVSFRLFEIQINGGLNECCDVLVPSDNGKSVPYPFANNAAKINAGLDIIKVLQKHYNTDIPIFVDNAESVTKLNKMDSQIIRLVVDESCNKLTLMNEGE